MKVSTIKNGLTMTRKHNHTDEELLDAVKQRLDARETERFFDQRLRTLSVDVLAAQERAKRRSSVIRTASLALGTVATAITLFFIDPFGATDQTSITTMPAPPSTAVSNVDLATTFVDDIIEEESLDLLAEASDPDPLVLTSEDIDQLFEGL